MTSLIDRYVRAVVRSLPGDRRDSVSTDLHGLIDAEVERRGGDDEAVRETLTEMGDPRRVAQAMVPHRHRIVGADQYPSYIRVLRDALLVVVPVAAFVGGFTETTLASGDRGSIVVSAVISALWSAVVVGVLVTVGFAAAGRFVPARTWTLDDLPDDTDTRRIAFADVVLEAVVVLVAFGLVCWQRIVPPIDTSDGESVPVLHPELWDLWLWVFFGLCVVSVAVLAVAYRKGRWTMGLAVANLAVDVALGALVVGLAASDQILNPEALDAIADHLDRDTLAAVPTGLVALLVGIALVLDAAGPLRAARR